MCGRNPISLNAATLSRAVMPCSDPATRARYTDFGSRFLARRWASATVSNHSLVLAMPSTPAPSSNRFTLASAASAGTPPQDQFGPPVRTADRSGSAQPVTAPNTDPSR